jgi:hypothetical protein
MKKLIRNDDTILDICMCSTDARKEIIDSIITASISSREITRNMVRVRSSNVWSYAIDIKKNGDNFGDVYTQFKGKNGGPGDIYVYYDVPVKLYRKWVSAPSKGHYFWQYIRNNFKYSKLTGDRRGKLRNAVN